MAVGLATLLAILVAEGFLAFFILARSANRASARFLAAFLLLHAFGHATLLASELAFVLGWSDRLTRTYLVYRSAFYILNAVPLVLVGFALTYPDFARRVRRARWSATLSVLWPLLLAAIDLSKGGDWHLRFEGTREGFVTYGWSIPFLLVLYLVGLILASVFFVFHLFRTSLGALSGLERQRLRYMARALGVPTLLAGLLFITLLASDVLILVLGFDSNEDVAGAILGTLFILAAILFILVPPFAMAYGLLKYQVLDIDVKVRFTIRHSVVATVFLACYVAATELAGELVTNQTHSALAGFAALVPLALFLHPLQRMADRVAARALPPPDDAEKYREFRRWEVYRATFEGLTADRKLTVQERRVLQTLAKTLSLSDSAASSIEEEVEKERSGRAAA